MPNKAVIFVLASFLMVVLICGLASASYVNAKKSDIICRSYGTGSFSSVECCQVIDGKKWCTTCDNTVPPSNCTNRYPGRTTIGVLAPIGANSTNAPSTNNNTSMPPPVGIVKAPRGTFNPTANTTNPSTNNPTNNTLAPLGPNAPTANNNTGTSPSGSIIKVPPGSTNAPVTNTNKTGTSEKMGNFEIQRLMSGFNEGNKTLAEAVGPTTNATNPSNGNATTLAKGLANGQHIPEVHIIVRKAGGVYSPTGYCSGSSHTTCIPCDPGLPANDCVPTSDWPLPSNTFTGKIGQGVASPLGNATNLGTTGTQQIPAGVQHHKGTSSAGSNSTSH